jgi:trehalose 6-phosphate synthase/phosphatase
MAKLIIVSNRLPVSVKKVDGELEFSSSIGGLATGLASVTTKGKSLWIGWPGVVDEELTAEDKVAIIKELKKHDCHPVFLPKKIVEDYYNYYSNRILWPLFHTLEVNAEVTQQSWQAYQRANDIFAAETLKMTNSGSTIWVHDYQLLLLPELLRKQRPTDKIGFFLHIPFPKPETWNTLPQAGPLIRGLMGSDLIGVHTPSYRDNFLATAKSLHIGTVLECKIALGKRVVRVAEFPLGINYTKFSQAIHLKFVQTETARLRWKYRGKKVILAFDRLDPTKGFMERLIAYRTLLKEHPDLHKKVVLVMVGNPTRQGVPEYQELKKKVESTVAEINQEFGTARWTPVDYQYTTMDYRQIAALFGRADIGFITPLRDGMNLNAKEYIASQQKTPGILVLSETAGAAEELKEAILVNPRRPRTMVEGLYSALTMRPHDLKRRLKTMQRHLSHFTAEKWADNFMSSLNKPRTISGVHRTITFKIPEQDKLIAQYHLAKKRLLMFDYDGTLVPIMKRPEDAIPSSGLSKQLSQLAKDEHNDIIIISGRTKKDLQEWFGDLPVALAAEHGALFRRKGGKNWHKTSQVDPIWKEEIGAIFDYYAERTPGSEVEKKEWALVWHYRNASPFYAQKHLVAIRQLIKPLLKRHGLVMVEGKKILEIHPAEINKGRIGQEWLIHDHDFILAIGDDTTDEDMFKAMPPESWSIKIGRGRTLANYRLASVDALHALLRKL